MKHRLLPVVATLVLGTAGWAVTGQCCDDHEKKTEASAATTSATAQGHTCTAEMAAKCTPAQAAACKAKGTSATTATYEGASKSKNTKASATTVDACCMSKSKSASATTASADKHAACASKGGVDAEAAVFMGAGTGAHAAGSGSCSGRGFTAAMEKYSHNGCDACADLTICDQELKSAGSITQVVKLKNGIMYVHTASSPSDVRALQAAMVRRNERLVAIAASGEKAKLCPDCKTMRGAIASGKLTREMVAIEGGCLTLMTSTDASMVNRLHAMAGLQTSARIKS